MIKTIAFDLGGVIMKIDDVEPILRFKEIGILDADQLINSYSQTGIFGDLEHGTLSEKDFLLNLSKHADKEITWNQCQYAWKGFVIDVPRKNLEALVNLRKQGYRLILVSNTNGFIQSWADSNEFSILGDPISKYFDKMYRSYEINKMKPNEDFFSYVIENEQNAPENILFVDDSNNNCEVAYKFGMRTYCPKNGEDWTNSILKILHS